MEVIMLLWLLGLFIARSAVYGYIFNVVFRQMRDPLRWGGYVAGAIFAGVIGLMMNVSIVGDLFLLIEITSTIFVLFHLWDNRHG